MRGKRADLSRLVFGNLTVLRTCYRLEVPQMLLARARELASGHPGLMSALEVFCLGLWAPALWVCTSPPGVPNGIFSLPGWMAIAGLGVSRGRLPGATPDG